MRSNTLNELRNTTETMVNGHRPDGEVIYFSCTGFVICYNYLLLFPKYDYMVFNTINKSEMLVDQNYYKASEAKSVNNKAVIE
jgi:hypothetical protein